MKAYLILTGINNDTELVTSYRYDLTLQKLNCTKCIQGYKITKATRDGIEIKDNIGEILLNLKTKRISYAQSRPNIYGTATLTFTGDLSQIGKNKWSGNATYTQGLQGETAFLEFGFC